MTKSIHAISAVIIVGGFLGGCCFIDVAWSASPIQIHTPTIHAPKINTPSTAKIHTSNTVQTQTSGINTSGPNFQESPITIGSASSGAGGGRATFAQFSITRKVDKSSPALFGNATAPPQPVNIGGGRHTGGQ
jgi:hypothetical protein